MHTISFQVGAEPNSTTRRESMSLKFKVEFQSDMYKAFVRKYFEDNIRTTHVIVNRSFFHTKVLVTQVLEIRDQRNEIHKVVANTKENRRKLGGSSSTPFLYLKEGTYYPLSLLGDNIIPLKSGQTELPFIEEIGKAISDMLSPLHDYFTMQRAHQSVLA